VAGDLPCLEASAHTIMPARYRTSSAYFPAYRDGGTEST
jgi:hypothetical protein